MLCLKDKPFYIFVQFYPLICQTINTGNNIYQKLSIYISDTNNYTLAIHANTHMVEFQSQKQYTLSTNFPWQIIPPKMDMK